MSSWTHYRAQTAALARSRTADDPDLIAARRNMRAARLADQIRTAVDTAPPLTPAQRAELSALINAQAGVA